MSSFDDDYSASDNDSCDECGEPVDEPWHRYCRDCYAEQMGWSRPARPPAGKPPPSFIAAVTQLREAYAKLEARVAELEHRRAA